MHSIQNRAEITQQNLSFVETFSFFFLRTKLRASHVLGSAVLLSHSPQQCTNFYSALKKAHAQMVT
jgi:hypothetical protein